MDRAENDAHADDIEFRQNEAFSSQRGQSQGTREEVSSAQNMQEEEMQEDHHTASELLPLPTVARAPTETHTGPYSDQATAAPGALVLSSLNVASNNVEPANSYSGGPDLAATLNSGPTRSPSMERAEPTSVDMEFEISSESPGAYDDDEDDDDFDSDEEDFLGGVFEDRSTPSATEMRHMEHFEQISALDHARWQKCVFKPLDDPEYRVKAVGTLSWTLEGFHGTRDAPNRNTVMRSPVTEIGGYKWNIKVFPRGCEGTDYLSFFLECSGPLNPHIQCGGQSEQPYPRVAQPHEYENWEIAAQIGCIMYNPEEPREYRFEQACHQFQRSNRDCGWVRFHGPWTDLHIRRPYHWRPMLTKDRLAFCVYLRTVEDPTRALWWRQTGGNIWHSIEKTGLRGVHSKGVAKDAISAALVPWFHFGPFKEILTQTLLSSPEEHLPSRSRPLLEALQNAFYQKHSIGSSPVDLSCIENILAWYAQGLSQSTDVIELWETIRFRLNEELRSVSEANGGVCDILNFVRIIRVDHGTKDLDLKLSTSTHLLPAKKQTAQGILDGLSLGSQNSYMDWEGYPTRAEDFPAVLQLELPRQRYNLAMREWSRLTHRIRIDDNVRLHSQRYQLFGLIVSKGKLGFGRAYAIVRASHIGSQWARYRNGTVVYLTRRQAIESHEGQGAAREGQESVAHVLIYVRADVAGKTLLSEVMRGTAPISPSLPQPQSLLLPSIQAKTATILVHFATGFQNFRGRGVLHPYEPADARQSCINFVANATVKDVGTYLNQQYGSSLLKHRLICSPIFWSSPPECLSAKPTRTGSIELQSLPGFPRVHLWAGLAPVESENVVSQEDSIAKEVDDRMTGYKEIFIKLFEPDERNGGPGTTGIFSRIVNVDLSIGQLLGEPYWEGDYSFFIEQPNGFEIKPAHVTMSSSISSEELKDLDILILAPRRSECDFTIQEYYEGLRHLQHWSYRGTVYRKAYFGGGCIQAQLRHGLVSGTGRQVHANGDRYEGTFRGGISHGTGIMHYSQTNDVYSGGWFEGERFGQGKMIYSRTGNIYEGGWRNGRRHGVGVMTFKIAEEELNLCKICFAQEIDVLLYRCGHILACETCARRCADCPICRRPVEAVVKIFDMRLT